jgi:hypothetical protein
MNYKDPIKQETHKLKTCIIKSGELTAIQKRFLLDKIEPAVWLVSSDGYHPYCSNCHYEPESIRMPMTPFCPNCGRRMRGASE